ncbi:Rieske 2Fe-2S domain-containing protein [Subtercola sp. YIM 133946]|uniref:Rieske 2Fe-2S domain-containing protein n=1 Tax=Subtercola sp. YIM 133946 TaxID=3118909 RepID=UPI002F91EA98
MKELRFVKAITAVENASALDPLVGRVQGVVRSVIRPQALRDLLHGVPFGHPLHPVEVQIPVGAFTSAAILDLLPVRGTDTAAQALIGVGVLSVLPAAVSGWTDWSELHEQQMRVGLVHAAANIIATGLYTASFVQRSRGKQGSGKLLALAGLATVSGAGFLGGHLSYRQAAGANHAEDVPHVFPTGWQALAALDDLPDNELARRVVADQPLLVYRRGDRVDVLSNVCSHLSGPLDEGELSLGDGGAVTDVGGGEACVTCPWHSSVFSLDTGEVVHGPATSPQPRFDVRVTDGQVEVLLPNAG